MQKSWRVVEQDLLSVRFLKYIPGKGGSTAWVSPGNVSSTQAELCGILHVLRWRKTVNTDGHALFLFCVQPLCKGIPNKQRPVWRCRHKVKSSQAGVREVEKKRNGCFFHSFLYCPTSFFFIYCSTSEWHVMKSATDWLRLDQNGKRRPSCNVTLK